MARCAPTCRRRRARVTRCACATPPASGWASSSRSTAATSSMAANPTWRAPSPCTCSAPYGTQDYAGWRANLDAINEFYFTDWSDSYAEAFGDRSARGVIAVAVYRRRWRRRPSRSRTGERSQLRMPSPRLPRPPRCGEVRCGAGGADEAARVDPADHDRVAEHRDRDSEFVSPIASPAWLTLAFTLSGVSDRIENVRSAARAPARVSRRHSGERAVGDGFRWEIGVVLGRIQRDRPRRLDAGDGCVAGPRRRLHRGGGGDCGRDGDRPDECEGSGTEQRYSDEKRRT